MSSFYGVYVADMRQPADQLVDRRVNRASAVKIARELNQRAIAAHPDVPVHKVPLYYVCRVDEIGQIGRNAAATAEDYVDG